jgi:hypothetical protein
MQGRKFSILTQKLFFWQAFKGVCRYRIFPVAIVNRKQEKRCEFYRKYLNYGASYFPSAVWHLKEGSSWMQGTKVQRFWQAFKNRHRTGTDLRRQLYFRLKGRWIQKGGMWKLPKGVFYYTSIQGFTIMNFVMKKIYRIE